MARHTFCNLQVDDDAPPEVIKMAYRALAKSCHPDFLGQKGHNVCILLNEVMLCMRRSDSCGKQVQMLALHSSLASRSLICNPFPVQAYAVLSDPDTRSQYNVQLEQALADEDDSFTGGAVVAALQHVRLPAQQ